MIVRKSSIFAQIQDLGRTNHRRFGVPVSGVMDRVSYYRANQLVGNPEGAPVFELAVQPFELEFEEQAQIAICGAECTILINEKLKTLDTVHEMRPGDRLRITNFRNGNFAYVAISGLLDVPEVMGSRSFYDGISPNSNPGNGDKIRIKAHNAPQPDKSQEKLSGKSSEILASPGPDFDLFKSELKSVSICISSHINRMGFRADPIEKQPIISREKESFGVFPGCVQLLPDGSWIILMRDAQTTGGYPVFLTIAEPGLSHISQLVPGSTTEIKIDYASEYRFRTSG